MGLELVWPFCFFKREKESERVLNKESCCGCFFVDSSVVPTNSVFGFNIVWWGSDSPFMRQKRVVFLENIFGWFLVWFFKQNKDFVKKGFF